MNRRTIAALIAMLSVAWLPALREPSFLGAVNRPLSTGGGGADSSCSNCIEGQGQVTVTNLVYHNTPESSYNGDCSWSDCDATNVWDWSRGQGAVLVAGTSNGLFNVTDPANTTYTNVSLSCANGELCGTYNLQQIYSANHTNAVTLTFTACSVPDLETCVHCSLLGQLGVLVTSNIYMNAPESYGDGIFAWDKCMFINNPITNGWAWSPGNDNVWVDLQTNGLYTVNVNASDTYTNIALTCATNKFCGAYFLQQIPYAGFTNSCQFYFWTPSTTTNYSGSITPVANVQLYMGYNDEAGSQGDDSGFFSVVFSPGGTFTVFGTNSAWTPGPYLTNGVSYTWVANGEIQFDNDGFKTRPDGTSTNSGAGYFCNTNLWIGANAQFCAEKLLLSLVFQTNGVCLP